MTSPKREIGTLRAAVDESVAAMRWLGASDAAAIKLAQTYADRIDADIAANSDASKTVYTLGPNLMATLKALGGAPAERKALVGSEESSGASKLGKLRTAHGGRTA